MKKVIVVFVLLVMNATQVFAQLPPLIDRDVFFGDPEISGAQISPDGNYITFLKPFNDVRNIWIKGFGEPFEEARPLTADTTRPIGSYFWSADSEFVLYGQDKGGDENFRVYAVDPEATGDPVPKARDLTPYEDVRAQILAVPQNTPNEIIIGLNDRDPQVHDVYRLNLSDGSRELLWKNEQNIAGWATDLEGNLRLGLKITQDGGTEMLKVDEDTLLSIYKVNNEETVNPLRFTPGGDSFYFVTNKGGELDKTQLMLYHLETDSIEFVEKDPLNEVDFGGAYFSDVTNELIYTSYVGDKRRVYFKNEEFEEDYEYLKTELPDGEVTIRSATEDENIWLVTVSRDVDPGSVYVFNRETGEVEHLYTSRPELPSEHLAEMKPVTYTARDGLEIPAYLTLPKGIEHKNLPTVLLIHGGPWARDYWGYDSQAQFLANRGYAVLQPNFRGSSGYGKAFLNAGNKEWGRGAMQHDITDAAHWLMEKGIADSNRIAIAGGSYGGYATLAGLAFTPDLYAAGFDIVGPSNIITLLNSIPPYWEPIKKMFAVRVGDMNDPEERKMLEEQSPLNYAENIKKPLFVVQGANDPRVKQAESDQIVVAMRELGRDVEYMVAPDEGHGFAGLENRLAMFYAMEKFLAKHLGGRYQESLAADVEQRYKEIMVDVDSVSLPQKQKTQKAGEVKSFNGDAVKLGENNYTVKVDARGQQMEMTMTRSVQKKQVDGKSVLMVADAITGGMMASTDTVYVDAKTLLPQKRRATQGNATLKVDFGNNKIEGMIDAGAQQMPVNVDVEYPVLADGANTELAVASLPLAENYRAQIEQFDMMAGMVKSMTVEVTGEESLEVNGESYEVFKVQVTPDESGGGASTLWVERGTNRVVKSETSLPAAMGGGTIITLLASK